MRSLSDKNKVNTEPFCPGCDRSLEMKHDLMSYYAEYFPTLVIHCRGCGKAMMVSEVGWREKKPK